MDRLHAFQRCSATSRSSAARWCIVRMVQVMAACCAFAAARALVRSGANSFSPPPAYSGVRREAGEPRLTVQCAASCAFQPPAPPPAPRDVSEVFFRARHVSPLFLQTLV